MATYLDQFFLIDPYAPPPAGTQLNYVKLTLTDNNNDGDFDRFSNDSIDGVDITSSWPGDTVTVDVPGVGNVTYTGVTFYLADGRKVFTPNDGQVLQNGTLVSTTFVDSQGPLLVNDLGPPCFTPGTLIRTARGEVPVEDLRVGDRVETLDNGLQEIRWIGRVRVDGTGRFAPVVFRPGAIGNARELRVSPQHRVLVRGWQAELHFGLPEMLVPARHLVDGETVVQEAVDTVVYHHVMLARHEVIFSNGVPSESFFPGDQVLLGDRATRAELLALFPQLDMAHAFAHTVRPIVKRREAPVLAPDFRPAQTSTSPTT